MENKMKKQELSVLLFGGTIEGRRLSDYLLKQQLKHTVCVATEYGEEVLGSLPKLRTVCQGRMNEEQMCAFLREKHFTLVIDATHPYALEVSKNIRAACKKEKVEYLRYLRQGNPGEVALTARKESAEDCGAAPAAAVATDAAVAPDATVETRSAVAAAAAAAADTTAGPDCIYVNSTQEAAAYLETQTGGIFLTTGSKELHRFTETLSDKSRIFARVLPSAEVIAACRALGLEGKQLCAMQGPFSADINAAMLKQAGSRFLVTKDTGKSGGFPEKLMAAGTCGVTAVIIRRPEETGYSFEEVKARVDALVKAEALGNGKENPETSDDDMVNPEATSPQITCIGIGMGTPETLTNQAQKAILAADVIFGARRILDCAVSLLSQVRPAAEPILVPEYNAAKISDWLTEHPGYRQAVILMSGDVGFYSGARQVEEVFAKKTEDAPAGKEDAAHCAETVPAVQYICGISSVVYFASKIPTAWQDAKLLSAHGKELAILNQVKRYPKIILLVSGAQDVERICRELWEYETETAADRDSEAEKSVSIESAVPYCAAQPSRIRITVGSNLSYPDEQIVSGSPADFLSCSTVGSHIMLIENPAAAHILTPGLPDEAFVRGKVPMTKEEIRALSIAKLRLTEEAVVYDVGAGTGSVAVECARLCTAGRVYAIERNPEGIELIRKNAKKIGVSNLYPVEGTAPEAMEQLPPPTHAFIGGSSGNMREIIECLRRKNPTVRIVLNTIALESIAEALQILKEQEHEADIVQVSAAKSRQLGRYHMMTAHNPVYIVAM